MTKMKKHIFTVFALLMTAGCFAQSPVNWKYFAKKVSDKTYEIHLLANLNEGWHIYSMKQPMGGIGGAPTTIKFTANPLVVLKGGLKEKGKMEVVKNEEVDIENHQYEKEVDFVQVIKLKANVKTNIAGTIEFMVCTEHMCLPVTTVGFNVEVN